MNNNYENQPKQHRALDLTSKILLVLTVLDILSIICNIIIYKLGSDPSTGGVAQTTVLAVLILMVGAASISMILELFCGIQGVRTASGKNTKPGFIKAAYILLIFTALGIIGSVINIVRNESFDFTICIQAAKMILVIVFIISGKTAIKKNSTDL